jgi:acyl carrier protein
MDAPPLDLFNASATALDINTVHAHVLAIVARCLDREPSEVRLNSRLWGELDAESLDMLDIVYSLERAFVIRLPRLNLLQRASDLFGESTMFDGAIITPAGLALMCAAMPEIPPTFFKPNMRINDFRQGITVESFVRVVVLCLNANRALRCYACQGTPRQIPDFPMEVCCSVCGAAMELPSGEELVIADLLRIGSELGIPRLPAPAPHVPAIASHS